MTRRFYFHLNKAPGDSVCFTAFLRDLKRAQPEWQLNASVSGGDAFLAHNPRLDSFPANDSGVEVVQSNYKQALIAAKIGAPSHFLESFHRDFTQQTGVAVPLTEPRPDLHLTAEEMMRRTHVRPYWIVVSGGKKDMPAKVWSHTRFQEVVDLTCRQVDWLQVGALRDGRGEHSHRPLRGAVDLLGQTSLRELMALVYHAEGVLCGVSMAMLLAAAFWRPCIVLAGGREGFHWQAITTDNPALGAAAGGVRVPHHFLHSVGQLPCSTLGGCWAATIFPPHTKSAFPRGFLCERPTREPDGQSLCECLGLISARQVAELVLTQPHVPPTPADV